MKPAARVIWAAGAVAASALLVSGCGMPSMGSTFSGGIFGSKKSENSWTPVVTEEGMLTAARNDTGGARSDAGQTDTGCPTFMVWVPDKVLTVYEAGHNNDSLSIIHRGEITKTARECGAEGNRMTVKYGIGGRVLLGPKGKPGAVLLPLVVNVYDVARNVVKTSRVKIETEVGADEPASYFSMVDTVDFPIAAGAAAKDYKIFVSFDPSGGALPRQPSNAGQKMRR